MINHWQKHLLYSTGWIRVNPNYSSKLKISHNWTTIPVFHHLYTRLEKWVGDMISPKSQLTQSVFLLNILNRPTSTARGRTPALSCTATGPNLCLIRIHVLDLGVSKPVKCTFHCADPGTRPCLPEGMWETWICRKKLLWSDERPTLKSLAIRHHVTPNIIINIESPEWSTEGGSSAAAPGRPVRTEGKMCGGGDQTNLRLSSTHAFAHNILYYHALIWFL